MTFNASHLRGLRIALAAAAMTPMLLRSARRESLWVIGLPAALIYFGAAFPGFILVIGLAYLVARRLGRIVDPASRWRWTLVALVLVVVLFAAGRLGHWDQQPIHLRETRPLMLWTLDMWLVLRLVTLFWEVGSGAVRIPSVRAYVGWIALPMTLGGPLLRYSELPAAFETQPSAWRSIAWWKDLMVGTAQLLGGTALGTLPEFIAGHWPEARLLRGVVLVFLSGPVGFYLTFAGYCQLLQTLARPAGLAIPDSFNWPFGRENISAFWANWNMTATRVFRDYLFYNRWGLRGYNAYVNTLILFGLVGLWHSANAYWVSWGLLHGIMFSGFLAWRRWKLAHQGHGAHAPGMLADLLARTATYVCVCAAWYLPSKVLRLLGVV